MFFDKDAETMARSEIERIQLEKLKKIAVYCYENVKLYKDKFDKAGFDPYKIKELGDIKYIPYTTKEDFRDNYPFGMFAVPMRQIVRMHASSGTTGKPTVVGYTKNDLNMWSDCMARIVCAAGATSDDIVQICFGYGLFTGALGLHYGLEKVGAAVVPSSSGNTEKTVMMMKDFGTTALVSTPSYALRIGEVMEELKIDPKDIKLRLGLLGSEGATPEMRDQIEQKLHMFVTDNYGMSELMGPGVSGECTERCGMHFCEDHFLPEIIDPATGEVLPEGSSGELVVTTLDKEGLPVLRYKTHDITSITYEKCRCGRTHARMMKPTGRTDDMLKIRGVNVFPSQIESVIMVIPEIAPYYQLVVGREGAADNLEVRVELQDASLLDDYRNLEELRSRIKHDLKTVLGISTKVSLVEPKTIERTAGKAKRVIDNRPKETATFSVEK
ncbi:MAG: phenylacetate--CoA ligase [Ruminiclostridium sp.]|nr:phenylacetate--CoA ligase [Ruminiclostridium sp.]